MLQPPDPQDCLAMLLHLPPLLPDVALASHGRLKGSRTPFIFSSCRDSKCSGLTSHLLLPAPPAISSGKFYPLSYLGIQVSMLSETISEPLSRQGTLHSDREHFVHEVKGALAAAGIDESAYSGHSFRIGAATKAVRANVKKMNDFPVIHP